MLKKFFPWRGPPGGGGGAAGPPHLKPHKKKRPAVAEQHFQPGNCRYRSLNVATKHTNLHASNSTRATSAIPSISVVRAILILLSSIISKANPISLLVRSNSSSTTAVNIGAAPLI